MVSLYQRLFTYRERQHRSPLEDYLTEALADLLNRMPERAVKGLTKSWLGQNREEVGDFDRVWPDGASALWTTQRPIDGNRFLDLLLEVDGRPVLIVENKIAAGFQRHTSLDEVKVEQHQLASYGLWLRREADPTWGGALVLLTHWTPAPDDFLVSAETYGAKHRSVARWAELSRRLGTLARQAEGLTSAWVQLASEFVSFLKELNMDSELAKSQDFAALQVYVASADRVRNSIERIWDDAKPIWRPVSQQTDIALEITTKYGCVWKFRYLARQDLRNCYLAVGIRFPELGDHPAYVDPTAGPYLFAELGSDVENSPLDGLKLPAPWSASPNLQLARLPLSALPSDADLFLSDAKRWVGERLGEVAPLLT